ncbi:MAG TPA: flagellar biosynthesis anti-sigma factor FlgM [Spirochaetales bacterium]|nr:flagellar biosynthesis anti-sigma factor FlgM [Spirochaetales bacterium]
MTIDRLNATDPIQNPKKPANVGRAKDVRSGDTIALSAEAREKAELFAGIEIAKAAPEVRADRVAELKAKLDDPRWIDQAVIEATADRILDQLL